MFEFLDNLRRKPRAVRKTVALATSGVLSGMIVLFWMATFSIRFPEASGRDMAAAAGSGERSRLIDPTPVASMYSDMRHEMDRARERVLVDFEDPNMSPEDDGALDESQGETVPFADPDHGFGESGEEHHHEDPHDADYWY